MATFIPTINPEDIENDGEREVAVKLDEQFPKSVLIYHSYEWVKTQEKSKNYKGKMQRHGLVEGETDFAILHPDLGIIVLEVKGGDIRFGTSGYYRQFPDGGNQAITDPMSQARNGMHKIIDMIGLAPEYAKPNGKAGNVPIPHRYGSVFPHTRVSGTYPAGAEPGLIIDGNHLDDLPGALRRLMTTWNGHLRPGTQINEVEFKTIRKALMPAFRLTPILSKTIKSQEQVLVRFTEEQSQILEILGRQRKAAIEGVAGSGKTLLAVQQARRFAEEEGLRTLFLCYNRPLADWIDYHLPDEARENLTVLSYHRLCEDWCLKRQIALPEMRDQNFWELIAPEKLEDAAILTPPDEKFQAVVIDEGQDFRPFWWESVERIFYDYEAEEKAPETAYFLFFDPKQNLYVENFEIPSRLGAPFLLKNNCRNTVAIAAHCGTILNIEIPVRTGAPTGTPPTIIVAKSTADAIKTAGKQIGCFHRHESKNPLFPSRAHCHLASVCGSGAYHGDTPRRGCVDRTHTKAF